MDSALTPTGIDIAIRLADDEVPISVIARALKAPADEIRDHLHDAVTQGRLIRIPRPDWHPQPRGVLPIVSPVTKMDEEELILNCVRLFKITRLQAALFSLLIRRNEVTKETMHQVIQQRRKHPTPDDTDPKMVDVVICHLRRRLRENSFDLEIKTIWACGYYMLPEHRQRAQSLLNEYLTTKPSGG